MASPVPFGYTLRRQEVPLRQSGSLYATSPEAILDSKPSTVHSPHSHGGTTSEATSTTVASLRNLREVFHWDFL